VSKGYTAVKNEGMFLVRSRRTGEIVGRASTLKRARLIVDKKDDEYGGYDSWIDRSQVLEEKSLPAKTSVARKLGGY
jgi:hypothetical protein